MGLPHTEISLIRIGAALALVALSEASAQDSVTTPLALSALRGSALIIRGSTTVGKGWSCTSTSIASTVILRDGTGGIAPASIQTVSIVVPVNSLRCQSGAMERAMRKALRADDPANAAIVAAFTAHRQGDAPHSSTAHLNGSLTVAGVERPVTVDAAVASVGDVLNVQSRIPLTLSQFNITAPRVLFGAVRARDAITVDVALLFQRE